MEQSPRKTESMSLEPISTPNKPELSQKIKSPPRKQETTPPPAYPQQYQQPEEHITIIFSSFKDAIRNGDAERLKEILQKYQEKYDLTNRLDPTTKQISTYLASLLPEESKSNEILRILLGYGANPHFIDGMKQSVLFYLSKEGHSTCVKLLLDKGLSPNQTDIHGQTPIYYAARDGKIEVLKVLYENGADINHKDNISNQTCLFYAARDGRYEACKYILEHGGQANHMDNKKQTPLNWAKRHNKKDVIELLQAHLAATKHKEGEKKPEKIKPKKEPENEVFIDKISVPIVEPPVEIVKKIEESNEAVRKRKREKYEAKISYKLVFTDESGKSNELTNTDFESFKQKYPQIAQMLVQADTTISDKMIKENKEKDTWEKNAKKILNTIWKIKGAFYFHTPVDPIKLKIDDYLDIVKKPMDFGTVKNKLNTNVYTCPEEFVNDVNLVFTNCVLYNGSESDVGKIGLNIQKEFEILLKANPFNLCLPQEKSTMELENRPESDEIYQNENDENDEASV